MKPEDWDEDAPKQIPDEDAEKPEGWLDDEPADLPDPGVTLRRPCPLPPLAVANRGRRRARDLAG